MASPPSVRTRSLAGGFFCGRLLALAGAFGGVTAETPDLEKNTWRVWKKTGAGRGEDARVSLTLLNRFPLGAEWQVWPRHRKRSGPPCRGYLLGRAVMWTPRLRVGVFFWAAIMLDGEGEGA